MTLFAKDTSNNVSSLTWNITVVAPAISAVVTSDKPAYQAGSTITFTGSLRDAANKPVVGLQIAIDDPLRKQSVVGPTTDSVGGFVYKVSVLPGADGNYVFVFYGGASPVYCAITINSGLGTQVSDNNFQVPLGSTNNPFDLNLALTKKFPNSAVASWFADTGGWKTFSFDLSSYKGQNVTVKFSSWTYDTINAVNYYLDDISIVA